MNGQKEKKMPKVGNKHFPYTAAGKKAAAAARKKMMGGGMMYGKKGMSKGGSTRKR